MSKKIVAPPNILYKCTAEKRYRLIGEITTLLMCSNLHRKYFVDDIGTEFIPPINLNQFRLYKKNTEPIALVTWAFLTKELEEKYATGDYSLRPKDWNAGDRGWIIDFLAPFGHAKEVIKDLKNNIFPDNRGKAVRVDANGKIKSIYTLHGRNISKQLKKKSPKESSTLN